MKIINVRILSFLLSAMMFLSMFSGCASDNNANEETSYGTTSVTEESTIVDEEHSNSNDDSVSADSSSVIESLGIDTESENEDMLTQEETKEPKDSIDPEDYSNETSFSDGLTDTQRNSLNMMNFLTVLTQEINQSKGSRVYLEKAYDSLFNNTYPNAVDARTQAQLGNILDSLEKYRMIDVKRERLEYLYEQNRAQAMRKAIPNPMSLLNVVQSGNYLKAAISVIYMAVDSYNSYSSYIEQTDLQYLKDGWELEDDEAEELHNSRKNAFAYMLSMVRDYGLPGDYALNEESVEEFVDWKNNTNNIRRIAFLEANADTYRAYGPYWLTLAESYYLSEDYVNCLAAIDEYEKVSSRIFRKDFEYAKVLPMGIVSAHETEDTNGYVEIAERYADAIIANTKESNDWTLRYFAAQTYIDLFSKTKNEKYLRSAYTIALGNVNYLVDEQKELNEKYISPITEEKAPEGATKREKEEVKQYNKMIKEKRKKELPPVSEALYLNCDLLFALADKLNITEKEKNRIDGILHENGESIFLVEPLDAKFWFSERKQCDSEEINIIFEGHKIIIPAKYLSSDFRISVSTDDDSIIDDWTVEEVKRPKDSDYSEYMVTFSSKLAKKKNYKPGDKIDLVITPITENQDETIKLSYDVVAKKVAFIFDGIDFQRA